MSLSPRARRLGVPLLLVMSASVCLGVSDCQSVPQMWTELVTMRDGVRLATDIHTPSGSAAPTIVMRTPYTKEAGAGEAEKFVDEGYSVVNQDIRGTGGSEGGFFLFMDDAWGERKDGYDTYEWIAAQSWSTNGACAYGFSALTITSYLSVGASHPYMRCAYAKSGDPDLYSHTVYQGGAIREEAIVDWLIGLQGTAGQGALDSLQAVYDHPLDDGFWDPISMHLRYEEVNVPTYHAAGWYDLFLQAGIDAFVGLQNSGGDGARGQQKLQIGPWSHWGTVGQIQFPNADQRGDQYREWFDFHLNNIPNGIDRQAAVTYFVMGDVDDELAPGNVWRTADAWPPPHTPTPWYLHSGGLLTRNGPDAADPAAGFIFDPNNPVPTVGGNNLTEVPGPWDQRLVVFRPDVLLYLSPELELPITIAGPVSARLWVSSSAIDTDFTVKLMDVYPDGMAINVVDGIRRMRSREGRDREVFMNPGEIYEAEVDLWSTAYAFNAGHRIAIAVSSSNYPRFDVNPNTGDWSWEGGAKVSASQVIYQDEAHPSHILLPVTN